MLLTLAAQAFFTSCNGDVGSDSGPTHYTVTFYKNYEGADPASFSFYCEEGKFSTLPTQLRKGYKFLGWAKTADATAPEYAGGGSVKVESNLAFYALWQKVESFKVTFDAGFIKDGDSAAETKIQTVNVSSSSEKFTLDKNTFTKAGSTFIGWNKYASGTVAQYTDKASISIYTDTRLYAVWKDDIVLTFNANGGIDSDFTKKIAYDTASSSYKFTVPESTFAKTGYVFIGWGNSASSKDASYKAGESASASESKTLYAIWAKESVPVRFDPNTENGGSGTPFTENLLLNTTTLKYEGTLPANTFTNSNGNFTGWCTYKKPSSGYQIGQIMSAGLTVSLSPSQLPNTEGFTLYAVWNPKTYTVTYNLGGNGTDIVKTVPNTAVKYGETIDYVLEGVPTPALTYYSLTEWHSVVYGSKRAGAAIKLRSDQTFYAVWKLNGTILDKKGTVYSRSQHSFTFKLLNKESLVFTATASGSNGLDFWLYDSNDVMISDKTKLTSATYTLNLNAGAYKLVINNGNWINDKTYSIKIAPAN
ncbi:InlB B-repeat-containing protein [Treponema socranskii]|uniref:InlB B-repeat-containing protein n=1 Tax=Treponema socranskii TaxID=53419 RepID=UPI0028E8DCCB|nr:InlB B-repeat-containing protein [Treponema socranskii]